MPETTLHAAIAELRDKYHAETLDQVNPKEVRDTYWNVGVDLNTLLPPPGEPPPAESPAPDKAVTTAAEWWRNKARDSNIPWSERFFNLENAYNHATNAYYAAIAAKPDSPANPVLKPCPDPLRDAWLKMAELWDHAEVDSHGEASVDKSCGICPLAKSLFTGEVLEQILKTIKAQPVQPGTTHHLAKWPFDAEGAKARAAFCRAQAEKCQAPAPACNCGVINGLHDARCPYGKDPLAPPPAPDGPAAVRFTREHRAELEWLERHACARILKLDLEDIALVTDYICRLKVLAGLTTLEEIAAIESEVRNANG